MPSALWAVGEVYGAREGTPCPRSNPSLRAHRGSPPSTLSAWGSRDHLRYVPSDFHHRRSDQVGMAILLSLGITLSIWCAVNWAHAGAQLWVARRFGVAVNRVSLGFGPTLWSRTVDGTVYRIALIPVAVIVRLRAPWSKD